MPSRVSEFHIDSTDKDLHILLFNRFLLSFLSTRDDSGLKLADSSNFLEIGYHLNLFFPKADLNFSNSIIFKFFFFKF